ncbi:MAG: hypothetical protein AAB795_03430 [Patescibacteria group bacterium]
MEQKPENPKEYFLDLDTQVSSVMVSMPDGGRRLVVKGADGITQLEVVYDAKGAPTKITQFSEKDRERVFTDPKILIEIEKQIKGLLGEKVEEKKIGRIAGAAQEGRAVSNEELVVGLVDDNWKQAETLRQFGNPGENLKGH